MNIEIHYTGKAGESLLTQLLIDATTFEPAKIYKARTAENSLPEGVVAFHYVEP
jgi:hypothetical protein